MTVAGGQEGSEGAVFGRVTILIPTTTPILRHEIRLSIKRKEWLFLSRFWMGIQPDYFKTTINMKGSGWSYFKKTRSRWKMTRIKNFSRFISSSCATDVIVRKKVGFDVSWCYSYIMTEANKIVMKAQAATTDTDRVHRDTEATLQLLFQVLHSLSRLGDVYSLDPTHKTYASNVLFYLDQRLNHQNVVSLPGYELLVRSSTEPVHPASSFCGRPGNPKRGPSSHKSVESSDL